MKPIYQRLLIIVVIFLIATVVSTYFLIRSYSELNTQLLERSALILGNAVEEALLNVADQNLEKLTPREKALLRSLMNSMTTETGSIIHILLINNEMTILLSSDRSIEGHKYKSPQELQNLQARQPHVLSKTWNDSTKVLDVIIPMINKENQIFSYLRLVLSQREMVSFYKDLSTVFFPIVAIFALLLFFTFYFVSRAYTQPLESLKKVAIQLDTGNFEENDDYTKKEEYTDTFKVLSDTIKKVGVLSEGYRKAEKRIANMLQVVDESIVLFDVHGRVISYNEAAKTIFRCPEDQAFPRYFELIKASSRELSNAISYAVLEGKVIENDEIIVWLPDGTDMQLRVSSQISREEGQITGILFTFKDLRLLKDLERNLQRSMQFGVITNLASSISHEIKNPLSSLAMHTDVLSNRIASMSIGDDEKILKSLNVLKTEGKRLNRIFDQFLKLARAKPADLSLIRINSIIEDVLVLVQQQAIERNVHIETELDKNLDFIYGDPDQLKQVFLNIVLNAFQAIGQTGKVLIRTRSDQKRIFVDISDNGKGMSPEDQQRVFDLYFSTKDDGAGVGLAISKNIMQMHEGRISFQSAPGKGTIFTLDFPKKDQTTQTRISVLTD
ncbi:MAG: ATP-binding protein [Calditrichaceae bacterium]